MQYVPRNFTFNAHMFRFSRLFKRHRYNFLRCRFSKGISKLHFVHSSCTNAIRTISRYLYKKRHPVYARLIILKTKCVPFCPAGNRQHSPFGHLPFKVDKYTRHVPYRCNKGVASKSGYKQRRF